MLTQFPLSFREVALYGFMLRFMIVDEFLMMWHKRSETSQSSTERMTACYVYCGSRVKFVRQDTTLEYGRKL